MVTQHPLVNKRYESFGLLGNEAAKLLGYGAVGDLVAPAFVTVACVIEQHFHTAGIATAQDSLNQIAEEYPYHHERFKRMGLEIAHFIDKLCKLYPESQLAQQLKESRVP